jgi:hypothetical protein
MSMRRRDAGDEKIADAAARTAIVSDHRSAA